jgi:surface antigen
MAMRGAAVPFRFALFYSTRIFAATFTSQKGTEPMKTKILTAGLVATIALSGAGCSGPHETSGTVVGASTGALIGAAATRGSPTAIAIGALAGALVGGEIGRRLDERDRMMYWQAANAAAAQPVGTTSSWSNPDSGNRGTVTPTSQPVRSADGRTCRNFTETITLKDGSSDTIRGRRCQNADGSWEFVG